MSRFRKNFRSAVKIILIVVTASVSCDKTTEPDKNPPEELITSWEYLGYEPYSGDSKLRVNKKLVLREDWTYTWNTYYDVFDSVEPPADEAETGKYEIRPATAVYKIDGKDLLKSNSEIVFHPTDKEPYNIGWELKNHVELVLVRPDGYTEHYYIFISASRD